LPVSEEAIPIPSSTSVSKQFAAVHGSARREALSGTLTIYSVGLRWSPFTLFAMINVVVIATYEIPHCSSGCKTAAVNKLVGELQQCLVPEAARINPLRGGFRPAAAPLVRCLPKGSRGQKRWTPCIPG